MTTTSPSALVEGPYATYDLPVKSFLWAAAMVNFTTSSTDSQTELRYMEWKSAQKRARS